jgi:hypothetical protein
MLIYLPTYLPTYHSPVVAKVKERLLVNKLTAQEVDMERYNLTNLRVMEVTEQYQLNISKFCSFGELK